MGLMSEVFNSVAARHPDPIRIQKANRAFKADQEQCRIEAARSAAQRKIQESHEKYHAMLAKKKDHSDRTKMGLAIRKAHDERGLPAMDRQQRKVALDFAMTVKSIEDVANKATKSIPLERISDFDVIKGETIERFDRKMDRLIRRIGS